MGSALPGCSCAGYGKGCAFDPIDKDQVENLGGLFDGVPPKPKPDLARYLSRALDEIESMMLARHKKYGTGNIAKHGPAGILVRMDDKFERLSNGNENFDDETVENTLDDIIGYALIWKLWLRGEWPGSPHSRKVAG